VAKVATYHLPAYLNATNAEEAEMLGYDKRGNIRQRNDDDTLQRVAHVTSIWSICKANPYPFPNEDNGLTWKMVTVPFKEA